MRYFLIVLFSFLGLLAYIAFLVEERLPGFLDVLSFCLVFLFWIVVQIGVVKLFTKNSLTGMALIILIVENIVFMVVYPPIEAAWKGYLTRVRTQGKVDRQVLAERGLEVPNFVAAPPSLKVLTAPKNFRAEGAKAVLYAAGVTGIPIAYRINFGNFKNGGGSVSLLETDAGETEVAIYADLGPPLGWNDNRKAQFLTFVAGCLRADWGKSKPRSEVECRGLAEKFVAPLFYPPPDFGWWERIVNRKKIETAEKFRILP